MSGSQIPFGSSSSKRLGKALEKSNFAHTCNLLSQYVKERGSIRDLDLAGITGKSEAIAKPEEFKATTTTLNLLKNVENSGQISSQLGKLVDPFPRLSPFVNSSAPDDNTTKASSSKEEAAGEPKRAQMTIFYAGEVMVFDDFPAEKAKEIMLLASSGGSGNGIACGSWKTPDINTEKSCFPAEKAKEIMLLASSGGSGKGNASGSWKIPNNNTEKSCSGDAVASSSKAPADPISTAAQESHQRPKPEANTSDLPIARRSSLHRFLEKRKDRAGARGPYQLHNNNNNNIDRPESSSKNDQEQLELKL